jgi:uncharacterized protein YndB with AHSA1/START domain
MFYATMELPMSYRIEKSIELNAPVARVWRALTSHEEFGAWFRVSLDQPFASGAVSTGHMTYPGYEDYPWRAVVERMDHERLFSFRWFHRDNDGEADATDLPCTLVEFRLEPCPAGTWLTITESGFEAIPDPRRLAILRSNTEGWNIQAGNIAAHVAANP